MSEKSFLMILWPIWSKIVFWKKKLPNLPKNTGNPRFFEFPQITKWPEVADNYSKTSACPKVFPKFFLCPKPKNSWWKYSKKKITPPPPPKKKKAFLGGDDDMKYRFRRVWRSMIGKFQINPRNHFTFFWLQKVTSQGRKWYKKMRFYLNTQNKWRQKV